MWSDDQTDVLENTWGHLALIVNRVLNVLIIIISIPVVILEIPITLIGGILAAVTLGIILLPLYLLWFLLDGILLGTSWIWKHVPVARPVLPIVGIPIALIADVLVSWTPSMGDLASKETKLNSIMLWPMSLEASDPTPGPVSPRKPAPRPTGLPPIVWGFATEEELDEALAKAAKRHPKHLPLLVSAEKTRGGCYYTLICSECGKATSGYQDDAILELDTLRVYDLPKGPWRIVDDAYEAELIESHKAMKFPSRRNIS